MPKIEVVQGDITKLEVDAIVNAARPSLLGGGGVDGAIHRAAGPLLKEFCEMLPERRPGIRCFTGEAFPSAGFNLPAKYVFHTVGPVYDETLRIPEREYLPPETDKDALLTQCYVNCLKLAEEFDCRTVAFPAISCGVYGCPIEKGAEIAFKAFKSRDWAIDKIFFVLYTEVDFMVSLKVWERSGAGGFDFASLGSDAGPAKGTAVLSDGEELDLGDFEW